MPSSPGPPLRRRRVVRTLVGGAFVVALVLALIREWDEVLRAVDQVSAWTLVLVFVTVVLANVANAMGWRAVLGGLGSPLPVTAAARIYLLAQLGKYVPGSVWPVLTQVELGRDHGVPRARSGVAAVAALVVGIVVGAIVAVAGLAVSRRDLLDDFWVLWLVVPAGLVLVAPPVLQRLVDVALRLTHRETEPHRLQSRSLLAAAGWSSILWLMLGTGTWLLLRDLTADASFLLAVGAYAAAWIAGFLVVVAPAGIGAREAALVALLVPPLQQGDALALALLSRIVTLLADAASAGGAVASARARGGSQALRR